MCVVTLSLPLSTSINNPTLNQQETHTTFPLNSERIPEFLLRYTIHYKAFFFSFLLFLLNQQLDMQSNVKRKQILFEGVNCRHYHTCLFTLQFCSCQHNKMVVSFKKPHSSSIDAYDLANLFLYLLFSWLSLIDSFLYAFFGKHRVWTLNRYGSSS